MNDARIDDLVLGRMVMCSHEWGHATVAAALVPGARVLLAEDFVVVDPPIKDRAVEQISAVAAQAVTFVFANAPDALNLRWPADRRVAAAAVGIDSVRKMRTDELSLIPPGYVLTERRLNVETDADLIREAALIEGPAAARVRGARDIGYAVALVCALAADTVVLHTLLEADETEDGVVEVSGCLLPGSFIRAVVDGGNVAAEFRNLASARINVSITKSRIDI